MRTRIGIFVIASFLLSLSAVGCGGGKAAETLTGNWHGSCTVAGIPGAVLLNISLDGASNFSGTLLDLTQGRMASLSGQLTSSSLNARYSAAGSTGTVTGTVAGPSAGPLTSDLVISEGGQQLAATCSFVRQSEGAVAGVSVDGLCNRMAQCSGVTLAASDLQFCGQVMAQLFQVVPDPTYTNDCFNRLTCTQLDSESTVQACLNLDPMSIHCSGTGLHGCTKTGQCTDVDCATACGVVGQTYAFCGMDDRKGYDTCHCAAAAPPVVDAGTGGAGGACANVAGIWTSTEVENGAACGNGTTTHTRTYEIKQTGCSITVKSSSVVFQGTVKDNQVSWKGSYPDGGGTTTIANSTLTVAADMTTATGTVSWTYNGAGQTCAGTTSISAKRGALPQVTMTAPVRGATDVKVNTRVTVGFSEELDTFDPAFFTLSAGGAPVSGRLQLSYGEFDFTPNLPLACATTYTATVRAGLPFKRNAPLPADYTWQFTTTCPHVVSTTPASGAQAVPIDSEIEVSFSGFADDVADSQFSLIDSTGAAVTGRILPQMDGFTFIPEGPLAYGRTYTATVRAGITFMDDAALPADYAWTFTTAAVPHGAWTWINETAAPETRSGHTAIWTGSAMIVWGGADFGSDFKTTGGRYDPISDSWRSTSTVAAPVNRAGHTAVWTAGLPNPCMIVWGGLDSTGKPLASGGRYDPATDTWHPVATSGSLDGASIAVPPASGHIALWNGTRMMVWGGNGESTNAGVVWLYDPVADSWTGVSGAGTPPEAAQNAAGAWTGTELLVWGGEAHANYLERVATGARFNLASGAWTPIATTGAPSARSGHTMLWTGKQAIVWGGNSNEGQPHDSALYDPALDRWTPMSTLNDPGSHAHPSVAWTGTEMIVWGGDWQPSDPPGSRYNPTTDLWNPFPTADEPSAGGSTMVWTGTDVIVWGGDFGHGWRYRP